MEVGKLNQIPTESNFSKIPSVCSQEQAQFCQLCCILPPNGWGTWQAVRGEDSSSHREAEI